MSSVTTTLNISCASGLLSLLSVEFIIIVAIYYPGKAWGGDEQSPTMSWKLSLTLGEQKASMGSRLNSLMTPLMSW